MTDTMIVGESGTLEPPLDTLSGEELDRLLFGRILGLAALEPVRPLTHALGLGRDALAALVARHAPDHAPLLSGLPADTGGDTGEDAIEEEDLRAFLLDHRASDAEEEVWLAAIVARRSLEPNHLWQDMGFASRRELNAMFRRHFPALVERNSADMKWKKFFYRSLCEREGLLLCKSPNCEVCEDFEACFGGEEGDPLSALARAVRAEEGLKGR
ncbi:nitrogen fixation protein NifQ [Azospirillum rugosum]|uniref:Nitrogen fixation protein NifQ n=1 Tax=Azospirillum rugosum TaxID=416170 RepID=A0ABS4SNT1_9PROT|nr:nitrogen fixation protein NifQ [Azospirillum rugosum]MBP2294221.1 nitrogen fixation protein NifQ [Azospirillum rugosum]MDQ0527390.1 nitrogen fixation protein NifQ [Azospirillum rugosum]